MICEAWLSQQVLGLSQKDLTNITRYFLALYGHHTVPLSAKEQLLATMRQDKKNEDHRINFSLLTAVGQAKINQTATAALIVDSLQYYNGLQV